MTKGKKKKKKKRKGSERNFFFQFQRGIYFGRGIFLFLEGEFYEVCQSKFRENLAWWGDVRSD